MAPSSMPQRPNRDTLRPTLRGPPRLDGTDNDDRQTQQAGRSATNLNAQASAQTFREASRSTSRDTRHAQQASAQSDVSAPPPPLAAPLFLQSIVSPHAPAISSPLNPTPPSSSITRESRKDSDTSVEISIRAPSPERIEVRHAGEDGTAGSSGEQTQTSRNFLGLPDTSSPLDSTTSLSGLSTPRSVRDLGSDYTRYFNPFATQNNSQQDLSTELPSSLPLPATQSVPAADLVKRLSNPFKDEKRVSSVYESAELVTMPKPPVPRRKSTEKDASAVVTTVDPPTRVGTPAFIHNADPEKAPFFSYMDDRLGAPCAFPLYIDQQEDDDDMHMPRWDDDQRYKPKFKDRFSKENLINTLGMIFLIMGMGVIFVVLPVISFTGTNLIPYTYDTPIDQMGNGNAVESWAYVNDKLYPLLQNVRTGLIDPDTPQSAMTRQGVNGETLKLVFSDEFNEQNRTFYPGDDPFWFAPDIWYGATQDMEWYDPDAVNTGGGTLQIGLDNFTNHNLGFRSGMLNSWNQLCFKGGKFEVSMSLPGPAGIHGLWPGAWTMGNLGRPGYTSTTDGVWPYTYDSCDAGITPNQSATDGMNWLPGQRLSSCSCANEDHPTPGTGRGAPEIDIVEVSADWAGKGFSVATQSYQVAPFDIFYYPNYDYMETPHYQFSYVNTYTGGPFQQAVSTTTMLNNDWYDGKAYQKYSFEYTPGAGESAGIAWFVGDDEMMRFDGRAIGPNGNIQQRLVSEEPMSMIINLGFSHSWVDINWVDLKFPTFLRVDYVRWYQPEGAEIVTCDPPGYETTDYIKAHPVAYNNPNLTSWAQTGYTWPKNTLMHGCSA